MKKLVLLLLLFVLPLQMSWAAASAYCLHEEGKAAQHLGHHSHQHKASAGDEPQPDAAGKDLKAKAKAHSDCNVCHGIGHAWLPPGASMPVFDMASLAIDTSSFLYVSHIPDGPKRPDWSPVIV